MKIIGRVFLVLLGSAAGLLLCLVLFFATFFDINDCRKAIIDAVFAHSGRTIHFSEDIHFDLMPTLGVQLGRLEISNAAGFAASPMIEIDSARVGVRFLPLFLGEIQFGPVQVKGLRLNLERDAAGSTNWDDLVGRKKSHGRRPEQADNTGLIFEVAGVEIHNATVTWQDHLAGRAFSLGDINCSTGRIANNTPFLVKGEFSYSQPESDFHGTIHFEGVSSADFLQHRWKHTSMHVSLVATGKDIPGGKGKLDIRLGQALVDIRQRHAEFQKLIVTGYGMVLRADGIIQGLLSDPDALEAQVEIPLFDIREVLERLKVDPLPNVHPAILSRAHGKGSFTYVPGKIELRDVTGQVDETSLLAGIQIEYAHDHPRCQISLNLGKLDLGQYFSRLKKTQNNLSRDSLPNPVSQVLGRILHGQWLKRVSIGAHVSAEKLLVRGIRFDTVQADLSAANGEIQSSSVTSGLYGGTLSASFSVQAAEKPPYTQLFFDLKKVDVRPFFSDMLGENSYAGLLDYTASVSFSGMHLSEIVKNVNGKVAFHLSDGVFPGVDLVRMARQTQAERAHRKPLKGSRLDSTRFGSITGSGILSAGVLQNKDLEVRAMGLRASGQGSLVLASHELDYLLKAKLVPISEGESDKASCDVFGIMVPIQVAGTVEEPHYWVSVSEYAKSLGASVIDTAGDLLRSVRDIFSGAGHSVAGKRAGMAE